MNSLPPADPLWQNAFLAAVILVFGWNVFAGWRTGVVRGLIGLAGLFAGGFVGLAIGGSLAPVLGAILPLPGAVIAGLVGVVVGIAIWLGARFLGALLFKRTAQQSSLLLRVIYGGGGAVVGALVGLTVVWGALLFVRGLGGIYEGQMEGRAGLADAPIPGPGARALVKLKRSLEAGESGQRLLAIDIVPDHYYRLLEKFGRVASRRETFYRLFEYPPITELLMDPRIVAITSDPAAHDAAREQSMGSLLQNRQIIEAANDPALLAKVRQIDLEAALDFALAGEPAAPGSAGEGARP